MHKYKEHINEARNSRKNKRAGRGDRFQNKQEQNQRFNQKFVLPSTKMKMVVSERFKYILNKMAESGNIVAKELLKSIDQKLESYETSYIDITPREDTLSYLPSGGKHLDDAEKFKSNKRQHSKIYKIIKTIFFNKFTKNDVQKFVSLYKSIYNKGPEKENLPPLTTDQMVEKLIKDTKNDKLIWKNTMYANGWVKYESKHEITDKKRLVFNFYIFNDKQESLTFLTAEMHNDLGQNKNERIKFIKNYNFTEVDELKKEIVKKYNVIIK